MLREQTALLSILLNPEKLQATANPPNWGKIDPRWVLQILDLDFQESACLLPSKSGFRTSEAWSVALFSLPISKQRNI